MNSKQKTQPHDRLYVHAYKLIKKHNPCKIKNRKCLAGKICCSGCKHLTKKGCSVACLACKLYLCCEAKEQFPFFCMFSYWDVFSRILKKILTHYKDKKWLEILIL